MAAKQTNFRDEVRANVFAGAAESTGNFGFNALTNQYGDLVGKDMLQPCQGVALPPAWRLPPNACLTNIDPGTPKNPPI